MLERESDELEKVLQLDDVAFSGCLEASSSDESSEFAFGFGLYWKNDGFIVLWWLNDVVSVDGILDRCNDSVMRYACVKAR